MSNYSDSNFDKSNHNTSWYKVFSSIKQKSRVLDVGCSSGNFGKVLIDKKGCLVDGIELDAKDVEQAAKKLNKVWKLNVETDDLKNVNVAHYDVIFFGDIVEHLVNPVKTLERVKPLLNKDGHVIFSIPNMAHIGVRLDLLTGQFEYTETGLLDKTHLHFYTQDEIFRIFEEAGYEITSLDFVQKDYPKVLLEKYLEKYGLRATPKFYKKMQETKASAFQFIGIAKPTSRLRKHELKQFGPVDLFETFYEDTKKNYEEQIGSLGKELKELRRNLDYKNEHPYRSVGGHIKRKLR